MIQGFALFIMGGNIFLGLVVFCVLLIVNFIVITKGAGRMAEVGARFALDAMPGKQLAIDSDLASGAITHEEAKARRKLEQEETTFFGSLDGASKFVKGDAVAGLLITLLNLLMGLAMGMGWYGLSFGAAIETYAMLTVGDGLVSQIPSVIISIAAALLLSKGGSLGAADKALISQLSAYPAALATVGVLMALFAFAPGLPFLPFIAGSVALLAGAWYANALSERKKKQETALAAAAAASETPAAPSNTLGDLIDVDEIHVEFATDLIEMAMDESAGLANRITNMRRHMASEFGFIMPEVRLTDNTLLAPGKYEIRIQGVKSASDNLKPGKILVLTSDDTPLDVVGDDVKEPVYGAAARWIPESEQEEAALLGLPVITPVEVVATHLLETVQRNFGRLLTRRALKKLLDEFVSPSDPKRADANKQLLADFVPEKISMDLLQAVLRHLLEERVPVRNLPLILEAIAEARPIIQSPELIADYVRQRIGFILVSKLVDDAGTLPLIQLAPDWETIFSEHQTGTEPGADVALPPNEFNRLANSIREGLAKAQPRRTLRRRRHLDPAPAVPARRFIGEGHRQSGAVLRRNRLERAAVRARDRVTSRRIDGTDDGAAA